MVKDKSQSPDQQKTNVKEHCYNPLCQSFLWRGQDMTAEQQFWSDGLSSPLGPNPVRPAFWSHLDHNSNHLPFPDGITNRRYLFFCWYKRLTCLWLEMTTLSCSCSSLSLHISNLLGGGQLGTTVMQMGTGTCLSWYWAAVHFNYGKG